MTIQKATASYEKWLGEQIPLLPEDLERKHEAMRSSPFLFLRATYYRWTQQWPHVKKSLRNAKQVLAVGDLHVENFGTWRDAEGRLVWGINDFDEACRLPYTYDLIRLAASARLATSAGNLAVEPRQRSSSTSSPGPRTGWHEAVKEMLDELHADWESWKKAPPVKFRKEE